MSLTANDLNEIRTIVESALTTQSEKSIRPIQDEIKALRNDIKEIYDMISELENSAFDNKFDSLSLEKKILTLNSKLVNAAKQAGITLPR